MTHGTQYGYKKGCRCALCCDAKRTAGTRRPTAKTRRVDDGWNGPTLKVSTLALRAAIDSDGRTVNELAEAAGVNVYRVFKVLKKGSASTATLDLIACALGKHMSELIA